MADKYYGAGQHVKNPFFPTENSYEGSHKTLISPHGSAFDLNVDSCAAWNELESTGKKLPGKHTKSVEVMGK
jgi:hypothetical protein